MKNGKWISFALVLFVELYASSMAYAQDRKVGVTAGYPASVGLLWQVSDRFALRPDVAWNWTSTETTSFLEITFGIPGVTPVQNQRIDIGNTLKNTTVGFGLSGLFAVHQRDALRLYLGGRGAYSRSTTKTTSASVSSSSLTAPTVTRRTITTDGDVYGVSAFFGGQYSLGERFAVFGELGPSYQWGDSRNDATPSSSIESKSASLRSGVGVVIFF